MRQYLPFSLLQLQRLIDLGRIDTTQPIDLSTICNTKILSVDPYHKQYGIQLTDEVACCLFEFSHSFDILLIFENLLTGC